MIPAAAAFVCAVLALAVMRLTWPVQSGRPRHRPNRDTAARLLAERRNR